MHPTLIDLGGLELQSYGVSKALAALAAGWLLQRELMRRGRSPQPAFSLALTGLLAGFLGAKLYYLVEAAARGGITMHDLGASGFTWYGGLLGGALGVLVVARRNGIGAAEMAGMAVIPLAVAYGIGRLGCLLAGDGTYGTPTDLPWAMSFPEGTMPTDEHVHPTPLYEALAAFAIAALLWTLRDRLTALAQFGLFAILFGGQRLLVEFVRLNDDVVAGLTAPQLWSLALVALGFTLLVRERGGRRSRSPRAATAAAAH